MLQEWNLSATCQFLRLPKEHDHELGKHMYGLGWFGQSTLLKHLGSELAALRRIGRFSRGGEFIPMLSGVHIYIYIYLSLSLSFIRFELERIHASSGHSKCRSTVPAG